MVIINLRNHSTKDADGHRGIAPLWEIVTGLTRLYFTNPDLETLRKTIGEDDYQHLLRINQKLETPST